jgi:hypothetical protein
VWHNIYNSWQLYKKCKQKVWCSWLTTQKATAEPQIRYLPLLFIYRTIVVWYNVKIINPRVCFTQKSPKHTEKSPRIGAYLLVIFEPRMGRIANDWWVHTESAELTECRAEWNCLTQTAQTFAEACGAKFCVFLWFLCATIFDIRTKVQIAPRSFAPSRENFSV